MTFGNLGEHYELVAMKSAGISLRKAMKPLIFLAVFFSLAAFYFSNYVLPVANLKFGSLLYDVRQQKLAFNLNEGIFNTGLENFVIYVGKKDDDNQTIYDVKIYDHSEMKGNTRITTAKKGIMMLTPDQKNIIFTLFDGKRYIENTDDKNYREARPFEMMKFEKQIIKFDLSEFQLNRTNEELFKTHYSMLNIQQLNKSIDSLSESLIEKNHAYKDKYYRQYSYIRTKDTIGQGSGQIMDSIVTSLKYPLLDNYSPAENAQIIDAALKGGRIARDNAIFFKNDYEGKQQIISKHIIVWHQKFKLSIACLIFFFIGAPLGAIIRKGGLGLPVVVSVVFFVLYHVVSITGEKAAKAGDWNIIFGVWLSTLLILPLGLFLTYKATTDAPLLDAESWKKTFDKFNFVKFFKKTTV
jgi:lipopolysaccharide export system permease protein